MKYSIRTLLLLLLLCAVASTIVVSRFSPVEISLGMDFSRVEHLLLYVNAESDPGMQSTYSVSVPYKPGTHTPIRKSSESSHNGTTMWHMPKLNITIGTVFVDDRLDEIEVWDWAGRKLDRYHHLLEYDVVTNLKIPILHRSYTAEVIRKENRGVNPPSEDGG